ncbi:hypothetical protein CEXT_32451 [Caerostris extrusa]|uniref:Uncharacterized protein n=1 Tax=Caerostris extrusa TaxID=172846 RepID=A0AAV4MRK5_CAEEX|nr:hypothetical protein CEXT_32451 [Caerostris extrusa]
MLSGAYLVLICGQVLQMITLLALTSYYIDSKPRQIIFLEEALPELLDSSQVPFEIPCGFSPFPHSSCVITSSAGLVSLNWKISSIEFSYGQA